MVIDYRYSTTRFSFSSSVGISLNQWQKQTIPLHVFGFGGIRNKFHRRCPRSDSVSSNQINSGECCNLKLYAATVRNFNVKFSVSARPYSKRLLKMPETDIQSIRAQTTSTSGKAVGATDIRKNAHLATPLLKNTFQTISKRILRSLSSVLLALIHNSIYLKICFK